MRPLCLLVALCSALSAQQPGPRSREDLEITLKLLGPGRPPQTGRMNPHDRTWEEWLRRTGELPPDFDAMPSIAEPPDPLAVTEGGRTTRIATVAEWNRRKPWIRAQVERWIFGKFPPAPGNVRAVAKGERRQGAATVREVLLEFGPEHRAKLNVTLVVPDGKGPFPVFLTNRGLNHSWIYTAVNRGYLVCAYNATDPKYGAPDDSDAYIEIWPEYDFSCLARWAWAASRAVDYLYTLPDVDRKSIGITGHSRNGKAALLAAAFDERITAAIPSSGLSGEFHPWRYTTDMFAIESVSLLAGAQPHWFHPRLRMFAGREHKLPVDQHMLMALVAPRGLMMFAGYAESAASPFALEQAYRSAMNVYRLHGREDNLWMHLREGEHSTETGDIEIFMDFFDTVFGRKKFPKSETWIAGYDFDGWKRITGAVVDPLRYPARKPGDFLAGIDSASQWEARKADVRGRISAALGPDAPRLPMLPRRRISEFSPPARTLLEQLFGRPTGEPHWQGRLRAAGMGLSAISFGEGLSGDLYYPVDAEGRRKPGKWPVVVWLHPYTYGPGWSARRPWEPKGSDFILDQRPSFASLVQRGFAVMAFDQIGFGSRIHEARRFYGRYPEWSLMGKMVADTRAAVASLAELEDIDASRIYLLGYALGAKVGLLTAAYDPAVSGVAAICGVDALRLDGPQKGTEGIRHYSHLHGLIPKLGFFAGHAPRVPFDYDEVLALAAPRPLLVVAPTLDRYAPVEDVRRVVDAGRKVYGLLGREGALTLETPVDFNRFPRDMQERVFDWLAAAAR